MPISTSEVLRRTGGDAAALGRRGTLFMAGSRVSGMAVGLLSSAVMGRLLSPADYGLVAMAMSLMLLLNLLKDFGLTTAVVQSEALNEDQLDAVFWINLYVTLGFAVLGALSAPWVAAFYKEAALQPIVYALCTSLLAVGLTGAHTALLRRQLNFAPLMWGEIVGQLCGLVIGVGLAWWTRSYWAIVASQLAAALATSLVMLIALPWRPGAPRQLRSAAALIRFGANLSVFSLLNFFSNQLGAILTGAWLGAGAAGHFNRAQQLLNLSGSTLMGPISQTTLPVLSRLQSDAEGYRAYYLHLLQRTSLFFGLLGAFVVVAGDAVARVLLGPQWEAAGQMYRWFGLSIMAVGLASQTGNVLLSQARSSELRHWGFGDAFIRAGASAIGVSLGAISVAAAFGVSTLFITVPIVFWIMGRKGPVSMPGQWAAVRPGLVCAGLVVAVGLAIRQFAWPGQAWLALVVGVTITIGATLLALMDPAVKRLWVEIVMDLSNALKRRKAA
ncbi:MAG: hypothetical protein CFE46_17835 [Burkholderiales bacterium PBB6]|nr:MAG: hypothetical protein CFE46_17835 [Burkholderiales bacterium PBB6]